MTAFKFLGSGCRGCPYHRERKAGVVTCANPRWKRSKNVKDEDIDLTPSWCPRSLAKYQERH
jgi:hypothetical protein